MDEDDEEEEETPLTRKKSKQTPNLRGSPSGLSKEKKPEPEVRVEPALPKKVEPRKEAKVRAAPSTPLTNLMGPFNDLIWILSAVRADWEVKNTTLCVVEDLVGGKVGSALPEAVANCISNPDMIQEPEDRVAK